MIWQISNIFSEVEKSFDNSFVYLDKSTTFATVFLRRLKIKNIPEDQILIVKIKNSNYVSDFTFSIIKPNAVRTGKTGPILAMINEGGFEIAAMRMVKNDTSTGRIILCSP